ncbi:MAG: ROK family protein [Actinomycetota bacterium]
MTEFDHADAAQRPAPVHAIGVDVGGTKILGVATAADGSIIERLIAPTPKAAAEVPGAISGVVGALIHEVGRPATVGVGVPGLVDNDGVLRYGPNVPGVVGLDMPARIRDDFDLPAVAENDASCAALAEHRFGAARGHDHAVIVTQGTGIGGGLIVNNGLLRGANGFAGEPGHMLIDRFGPVCACGTQGCWEAVASGAGLANIARQFVEEGRAGKVLANAGGVAEHIRGEHVAAALADADDDALAIIDRFAWWVAQGLASLITLLDPGVVVLGGGLTAISSAFIPDVQERVADTVLGGAHRPTVPIRSAQLGAEAGAYGASLLAAETLAG